MKKVLATLCALGIFTTAGIAFADVPSAQIGYTIETENYNPGNVDATFSYQYIKLKNPDIFPALNQICTKQFDNIDNQAIGSLEELGKNAREISADSGKKYIGHFEAELLMGRADNIVFSYEETIAKHYGQGHAEINVMPYNFNSSNGNRIEHFHLFKDQDARLAFAELLGKKFAAKFDQPTIKNIPAKDYLDKLLWYNLFCLTKNGIKVSVSGLTSAPMEVEVPYAEADEYINLAYNPLK